MWYFSLPSCLCLQLLSTLECNFLARLLLNIVPGRLLTCYSTLPWVLLVMHVPSMLALAMLSLLDMYTSCWLPSNAMRCLVMSELSLQSCYHESVPAMSYFSSKCETVNITCHVCMGTTLFSMPLWVMISKRVLFYVLSTSMQSSLRDVADFCDLVIYESVIFCCYVNLLLQVILCIIWRCSLRMFCYTCYALSIHAHVCNYGVT